MNFKYCSTHFILWSLYFICICSKSAFLLHHMEKLLISRNVLKISWT